MTYIIAGCFLVLTISALLALLRIDRGRSTLDRMLALDVTTAIVLCGVILVAAATGRDDVIPVLVVLSLVGFVGSVTIARFAAAESADEARILTAEELRAEYARLRAVESDEAPPVHDVDQVVIAVLDVPGGYRSRVRPSPRPRPKEEEE